MAQAKTLSVGGIGYEVIDDTARSNAQTALNNAEYNRQGQIGKYGGQNIATILAGEIGSGSVYDALHKRAANGNFAGLRVGDYIDVPLVSASGVAAQQSVRFLLAHFDPYYCCGDSSKGHHIAFVASAPIAVAKTVTGVANDSFLMWNTTNTNQGTADQKCPYPNSNLKAWETAFEACLPESLTKYLLTQRVLLEERYSASGALNDSNSWSWQDIGKVFSLSEISREDAIAASKERAREEAIDAGADPDTVEVVEVEDIPMAYLGDALCIRVKAVGNLRVAQP